MARPPRLNATRARRFAESIEAGNTIPAAAETSGMGTRSAHRYLARGEAAEEQVKAWIDALDTEAQDQLDHATEDELLAQSLAQIPDAEQPYWQFWQAVSRARAAAEERAVSSLREVGLGYEARETVTETRQVMKPNGEMQELVSTRTTVKFVRDWRAELAWLERARRVEWGRPAVPLEVTGAGGGPVSVEDVESKRQRAVALVTDQVAEKRRQRDRAAGLPVYGPPVPAELEANGSG